MPNPDENMKNVASGSDPLEESVFNLLNERGEIIPESLEDVTRAEKRLAENPPSLPERLKDARKMLARIKARNRERSSKVIKFPEMASMKIEEEMAWAARNGGEITPDIQEKMRQNRAKALSDLEKQKLG
jgi:hypothetical protein